MKLGILQMDPDLVIFQKSAVGILYGYSTFSTISFRVIDAWYSGFLIIGLLYYAQDYQGSLYLRYSDSFIAQPRHQQFYCTATASAVLFSIIRRFIQPEVQRMINVQST